MKKQSRTQVLLDHIKEEVYRYTILIQQNAELGLNPPCYSLKKTKSRHSIERNVKYEEIDLQMTSREMSFVRDYVEKIISEQQL